MNNGPSKEELEKTKLNLEIGELSTPLYRKPALYAVLGPTLLAAATLSLGFYTGLFDVKNEAIRNQSALLEIRKIELNGEIALLETRRKKLDEQLKAVEDRSMADIARVKLESNAEIERIKAELGAHHGRRAGEI